MFQSISSEPFFLIYYIPLEGKKHFSQKEIFKLRFFQKNPEKAKRLKLDRTFISCLTAV